MFVPWTSFLNSEPFVENLFSELIVVNKITTISVAVVHSKNATYFVGNSAAKVLNLRDRVQSFTDPYFNFAEFPTPTNCLFDYRVTLSATESLVWPISSILDRTFGTDISSVGNLECARYFQNPPTANWDIERCEDSNRGKLLPQCIRPAKKNYY
jgi:hypothetical protein